jgi:hypothetical protein
MPSLVGLKNKRNVNSRILWVNIIEGSIEEILQVPTLYLSCIAKLFPAARQYFSIEKHALIQYTGNFLTEKNIVAKKDEILKLESIAVAVVLNSTLI